MTEVYRKVNGTEFPFPLPYTIPTALPLTFTIIYPETFTFDSVRVVGSQVIFTKKNASMYEDEIELVMMASVNLTLFTTV